LIEFTVAIMLVVLVYTWVGILPRAPTTDRVITFATFAAYVLIVMMMSIATLWLFD
jgi:hypothetical protein